MPSIVRPSATAVGSRFARLPLDHSLTVGRQAMPGQIVLDHPNVSLRHAALDVADGCIVLRDLGGTNVPMSTALHCAVLALWCLEIGLILAHSVLRSMERHSSAPGGSAVLSCWHKGFATMCRTDVAVAL